MKPSRVCYVASVIALCGCTGNTAVVPVFSLEQTRAVRLPQRVVLSANAARIAYVVGDTLWIANAHTGRDRRPVSAGMARASETFRPFLALSPDGARLTFLMGDQDSSRAMLAELGDTIAVRRLLPDSLHTRLVLFRHFAAGGASWSADGQQVAFLASDRGANTATPDPLQVYTYNVATGQTTRVTNDRHMHYDVAWSPTAQLYAYIVQGDVPGTVQLVLANADGSARAVLDTVKAGYASDLLWSPDGTQLTLFTAQGSTRVYQIPSDATVSTLARTARRTAPREIPRRRFVGWTAVGTELLGAQRNGMSSQLIAYSTSRDTVRTLTSLDTLFVPIASAAQGDTTWYVYSAESGDMPRDIWVHRLAPDGTASRHRLTDEHGGVKALLPGTSRIVHWNVADGLGMDAELFVPNTRGPHKLVVIPYGGYVNAFPSSDYFLEFGIYPLVARGYAVIRPNTRGPASGAAVPGEYGRLQLTDTDALLDTLAKQGLILPDRVAVLGHSHGGSLAYYYATHSRRFCAAVAINGRADWEMQATKGDAFLVTHMGGTPDSVPERYRELSPLRNAANTTVPLLAVTGMRDTQIYPENGRSMVNALHALGKPAELMEFENDDHMIATPDNLDRLWRNIFAFLETNCGWGKP